VVTTQTNPGPARRTLDILDYLYILKRRKGLWLALTFAGLVLGVVAAYILPQRYIAVGSLRFLPQQVPERLVPTNIVDEVNQRINLMYQTIARRENLINIIKEHKLYQDRLQSQTLEDTVELMRKDINIQLVRGVTRGPQRGSGGMAFTVAFTYPERQTAIQVCQQFISRFVDENIRLRSVQSVTTTEFLKEEAEAAKRHLDEIDSQVAAMRIANSPELPEQSSAMVGRLSALEAGVQNLNASMSRLTQAKMQLESQLSIGADRIRTTEAASAVARTPTQQTSAVVRNARLAALEKEISGLETTLLSFSVRYRPDHPDIISLENALAKKRAEQTQLREQWEAEQARIADAAKQAAANPVPSTAPPNPELVKLRDTAKLIQTAIQARELEMEEVTKQLRDTNGKIKALQAHLTLSPTIQQRYSQLLQDRDIAQKNYNELSVKYQQSLLASNLESRRQGEALEMLEPAIAPLDPNFPKRPLVIFAGLFAGLALGIGLTLVYEINARELRRVKDIETFSGLRILASIPKLVDRNVIRKNRIAAGLRWSAAVALGCILMAGALYYHLYLRPNGTTLPWEAWI